MAIFTRIVVIPQLSDVAAVVKASERRSGETVADVSDVQLIIKSARSELTPQRRATDRSDTGAGPT
jgi:hypothetical protein